MIKNYSEEITEKEYLNVKMLGCEEKEGRRHTSEYNTLYFIISGKGYFDSIPIGAGDGFAVRKNCTAEYAPDKTEPWTYCLIGFDGKAADGLLDAAGLGGNKCTFSLKDNARIAELIRSALDFNYGKTDVGMHLDSVLLEIFACLIAEKPDRFANDTVSVMENRVKSGIEFINENFREKNCIDMLAKAENVNKRYMSRLFRRFSDLSPQGHLIRARIEEAKRLLRSTSLSVSDIGASVGYDDVMQFSKIFKKHTGLSPTAYREGKRE